MMLSLHGTDQDIWTMLSLMSPDDAANHLHHAESCIKSTCMRLNAA